jgi:hypothetical protein
MRIEWSADALADWQAISEHKLISSGDTGAVARLGAEIE